MRKLRKILAKKGKKGGERERRGEGKEKEGRGGVRDESVASLQPCRRKQQREREREREV